MSINRLFFSEAGCHINPAITLGLVVGGKIGIIKVRYQIYLNEE
jgi:glycerol uptake facilitator-like aquaporin